jgi:CRP-like cAMP-binding protein
MQYNLPALLKKAFDAFYETPIEAWTEYANSCEIIEVPAETVLKKARRSEYYFYFIIKGSVGLFLLKDPNYVCIDFAFEMQFCADYMSIITDTATPLEMRTIEPCILARMPVATFRQLGRTPMGLQIMLISAEVSFVDKQQQQIDLLTKSATQRLQELENHYPGIADRVAQKYIASYLGITPQSLSRIRRLNN